MSYRIIYDFLLKYYFEKGQAYKEWEYDIFPIERIYFFAKANIFSTFETNKKKTINKICENIRTEYILFYCDKLKGYLFSV